MNNYKILKRALLSAHIEAKNALAEGLNNRVAIKESTKEFPFNYISVFKLFLDYGPYLYRHFIFDNINITDPYRELISPIALNRFFRILIISHQIGVMIGQSELSNDQIRKLDDFTKIIESLTKRVNEYNKSILNEIRDYNSYFTSNKDYLALAAILRTDLNEICEYEFLGEQNWGRQVYTPIVKDKFLLLTNSYVDWNPLMHKESFSKTRMVDLYPSNVDYEYSESREKIVRPPIISTSKGVHIEIDENIPSAEEIKEEIKSIENRFKNAESYFKSTKMKDLEYYYIKRHLTPLYIVQSKYKSPSWEPPREIKDSVYSEKFSKYIYPNDLYVIRYYKLLFQGSIYLLNQVDSYE